MSALKFDQQDVIKKIFLLLLIILPYLLKEEQRGNRTAGLWQQYSFSLPKNSKYLYKYSLMACGEGEEGERKRKREGGKGGDSPPSPAGGKHDKTLLLFFLIIPKMCTPISTHQ